MDQSLEEDEIPSASSIGLCAGSIWNYLNSNGRTSIIKLKSEICCTTTVIHLALGWLLREGKIELKGENGYLFVNLR